jgi:hypothetical protein
MTRLETIGMRALLHRTLEYLEPLAHIHNGHPCQGCWADYTFKEESPHKENCPLEELIVVIKEFLGGST